MSKATKRKRATANDPGGVKIGLAMGRDLVRSWIKRQRATLQQEDAGDKWPEYARGVLTTLAALEDHLAEQRKA